MANEASLPTELMTMRKYFDSGQTTSYEFRKKQLLILKKAIEKYEREIYEALYKDLQNSKEEVYATESGIVIAEISYTLKRLRKWMKPARIRTNLLNFPSSTRLYRDPLGITLIIGSWNYPFQLVILPLVGAIAGGNCAVLKPSEVAPATSEIIAHMIRETFPPEYIRVYEGEGSKVVPALMENFRFDHIFYTGSGGVGKSIYEAAAKKLIPVTLELGGKSPAIVEQDADLKVAARRIALGKFVNAGQTCVAPDYVLVHHSIKERFLSELKHYTKEFFGEKAGNNPEYGKIVNERRFEALLSFLAESDKIFYGGDHRREELFLEPTILTGVTVHDKVMKEEIFGPILPVISVADRQEALSIVKENEKPLSFYLFTKRSENVKWWMDKVSFGGGCVNNTLWHLSNPNLPFGGVGASGIGNYHGKYSFETFTHAKAVMKTPVWFDPDFKYPPFKGKLKLFKKFIK